MSWMITFVTSSWKTSLMSKTSLLLSIFFPLLFALNSSQSFAEPKQAEKKDPDPQFNSETVRQINHCQFAGEEFDLVSAGLSRDFDAEESYFGTKVLWVQHKGKKTILAAREDILEYGEFSVTRFGDSTTMANCFAMQAIPMNDKVIALAFIQDARPGGDNVGAIFYDVKAHQVLEFKILGSLASRIGDAFFGSERAASLGIPVDLVGPRAIYLQTKESRSEAFTGQASIDGRKQNYEDEDLGVIKKIFWDGQRAVIQDDVQATWARSPWSPYFKDVEEFKSLSGWNESTHSFKYPMIFVTSGDKNKRTARCFQFGQANSLKPTNWICRKPKS